MSTSQQHPAQEIATPEPTGNHTERLILVYDGDSGLSAMILDVLKKTVGREDCPLCAITYGPLGKREEWRECEARLGLVVEERHRDQLPQGWAIGRADLPCVLHQQGEQLPTVLLSRDDIAACGGSARALEYRIAGALGAGHSP